MATSLSNIELTVLFCIMANMNKHNVINISSELRLLIEKKAGVSKASIYKALNGLKEKKVLIYPIDEALREKYNIYSKNSFIVNLG